MIVPLEKPGTPGELVHFGIKGMKWGVRKERSTGGTSKGPFWTPKRKSIAKKVAIGVSVAAVIAGTAFVAYKLNQSGKLALPRSNRHPADIQRLLDKHGSVRVSGRELKRIRSMEAADIARRQRWYEIMSEGSRAAARATTPLPRAID